jgi:putative ABC transport system substrate-binding protein
MKIPRRSFITLIGAVAAWPLAARSQEGSRVRRIGVLMGYAKNDPETTTRLQAFRHRLEKRGWSENRNVTIEARFVAGRSDQYQTFANELVALQPDVIVAHTTLVAAALQRATRTIPVVFVNVSDPIGSGFVTSLARPEGNLTGVLHYEPGIVGKWLALLKEIAPNLRRVAVVANPKTTPYDYLLKAAQAVAPSLAIALVSSPVGSADDIKGVIESLAGQSNVGMLLPPDSTTIAHRDIIIAGAAHHWLPAVYAFDYFVKAGGLIAYGTDQVEMFRQVGSYVDRILRGDKATDLPVQAPTRYETSINLVTAKSLGLKVPNSLLVAADEMIE